MLRHPEPSLWIIVFAYHLLSRLAYVVGVGVALVKQDREQFFTRRYGADEGFRRFRRMASIVMNNDALSFVLLCLVTRQTLVLPVPSSVLVAGGVLLMLAGVSVKLWAAARLGPPAYYWHNFFVPAEPVMPDPPGPYRFLKNPMYTLGYLHAYGFALALGSWIGLLAAMLDQAAILVFHHRVEKPHFDQLQTGVARR